MRDGAVRTDFRLRVDHDHEWVPEIEAWSDLGEWIDHHEEPVRKPVEEKLDNRIEDEARPLALPEIAAEPEEQSKAKAGLAAQRCEKKAQVRISEIAVKVRRDRFRKRPPIGEEDFRLPPHVIACRAFAGDLA